MNEGLLEDESAVFSIGFCKPGVNKKTKSFFSPELCAKRSQVCQFLQNHCNKGTNSWENSDLTSAHTVLCLEREKKTIQKNLAVKTDKEFLDKLKMRSSAAGVLSLTLMLNTLFRAGSGGNNGCTLLKFGLMYCAGQ